MVEPNKSAENFSLTWAIPLACVFAFALTQQCAAAPSSKTIRAVVLKQTHYFFGRLGLEASNVGLRIQSEGSWKFILVAKAPDWKVTVFRTDDKVCHEASLKQFVDTGLVSQYMLGMRDKDVQGTEQPTHELIGNIRLKRRTNGWTVCDYIPLSNLVAPECRSIIFNMYRIPNCGGLTRDFRQKGAGKDWMTGADETGKWISHLSTNSASISEVDSKDFDPPPHYKMVPSMQQVVTSKAARDSSGSGADELLRVR